MLGKTFKTRVTVLVAWSGHVHTEFPAIASAAVKNQLTFLNRQLALHFRHVRDFSVCKTWINTWIFTFI